MQHPPHLPGSARGRRCACGDQRDHAHREEQQERPRSEEVRMLTEVAVIIPKLKMGAIAWPLHHYGAEEETRCTGEERAEAPRRTPASEDSALLQHPTLECLRDYE